VHLQARTAEVQVQARHGAALSTHLAAPGCAPQHRYPSSPQHCLASAPLLQSIKPQPVMTIPGLPVLAPETKPQHRYPSSPQHCLASAPLLQSIKPQPVMTIPGLPVLAPETKPQLPQPSADEIARQRRARRVA
jgi:hypothetical protein